jgi:hypothetical protein
VAALKQELAAVRAAAAAVAAPGQSVPEPVDDALTAPEGSADPATPADTAPADPAPADATSSPSARTDGGGRRPEVGGLFSRTGRWSGARDGRSSILAASRSSDVSVAG